MKKNSLPLLVVAIVVSWLAPLNPASAQTTAFTYQGFLTDGGAPANGVYDLNTRLAGSSANLVSRTAVSFVAGRIYTIGARGDITLPSSGTATNRASLDNTLNR